MNPDPNAKRVIPDEVLDLPVQGLGLAAGALRDQISEDVTVLAFLRHFG